MAKGSTKARTAGDGIGGTEPALLPKAEPVPGTKILLRRSGVKGRTPTAGDAAYGELFINYHSGDPMLCFKDNSDNIVEIKPTRSIDGGGGEEPPDTGNQEGDTLWDGTNFLVWSGTEWVKVGPATIAYQVKNSGQDGTIILGPNGDEAIIDNATVSAAGLMTKQDKAKLDSYPSTGAGMDLQQVTDYGNTTTNFIDVGETGGNAASANPGVVLDPSDGGIYSFTKSDAAYALRVYNSTAITSSIKADGHGVFTGQLDILRSTANSSKLTFTRTDASWSINNETGLRFYYETGDTVNPSNVALNITNAGAVTCGGFTDGDVLKPGIVLDNNGSASFAGGKLTIDDNGLTESYSGFSSRIDVDGGLPSPTRSGMYLSPGSLYLSATSDNPGSHALFSGCSTHLGQETVRISADGSAIFAGKLSPGYLHIDDSAFYADDNQLIRIQQDGTNNFIVFGNGSANFAGENIKLYENGSIDSFRVNTDSGPCFSALSGANYAGRTQVAVINNDGSASFAGGDITLGPDGGGYLIVGGNPSNGASEGASLSGSGQVTVAAENDNDSLWQGYKVGAGAGNFSSTILADGSGTFAGGVGFGIGLPTPGNSWPVHVTGNTDNTNNWGEIRISSDAVTTPSISINQWNGADAYVKTVGINSDGSAELTGRLSIKDSNAPWIEVGYGTPGTADHRIRWDQNKLYISADVANLVDDSGIIFNIDTAPVLSIDKGGNAQFPKGYVASGDFNTGTYSVIDESGVLTAYKAVDTSDETTAIQVVRSGNLQYQVRTDGEVQIGGNVPSAPNIKLSADGSASFASEVTVGGPRGTENAAYITTEGDIVSDRTDPESNCFYALNKGDTKVLIKSGGSGSFASHIQSGGDPSGGTATGCKFFSFGTVEVSGTENTNPVWKGNKTGTGTTSYIFADGSASFAAGEIVLNSDGSGYYQQTLTVGHKDGNGVDGIGLVADSSSVAATNASIVARNKGVGGKLWRGTNTDYTTETSVIYNDGRASFARTVLAGFTENPESGLQTNNNSAVNATINAQNKSAIGNVFEGRDNTSGTGILTSAIGTTGNFRLGLNPANSSTNENGLFLAGPLGRQTIYKQSTQVDPFISCIKNNGAGGGDTVFEVKNDGSSLFAGNVISNGTIGFNLEADDPDAYKVTTEEYTDVEYYTETEEYTELEEYSIEVPVIERPGAETADIERPAIGDQLEDDAWRETRTVTRTREVTKEREVTKAREVTKEREVKEYIGPVYDVKDRLLKVDAALLHLKEAVMTAGTCEELKSAIITALADVA